MTNVVFRQFTRSIKYRVTYIPKEGQIVMPELPCSPHKWYEQVLSIEKLPYEHVKRCDSFFSAEVH